MKKILLHIILVLSLASCANRGLGPQGGKKDITPPRVARSTPENKAINVSSQRIEINFDEYVLLDDAYNNVTVSPPQKQMPVIKLAGKKITVELKDTLKENTTYTIDFGNAIADNNEKNLLPNFAFAFTTGAELDTLQISGTLLNAQTLDPAANNLVGIHSNLSDTAFTALPFDRITKTDANGRFSVKNVKAGSYRVFALSQNVNDGYRFDPKSPVAVAFSEHSVQPDTLTADTVKTADSLRYNNLILFQYEEQKLPDSIVADSTKTAADSLTLKKEEKKKELKISSNLNNGKLEYYDTLKIFFNTPIKEILLEKIRLRHGKDTLDMPCKLLQINDTTCKIAAVLNEGESYTLALDSAALVFTDTLFKTNDKTAMSFKRRSLNEYSTLAIDLQPFNSRIIVELLNDKDQSIRQVKAESGGTYFDFIEAGNYYLRLYIDENGDETWNGGSYAEQRQPEKVYYYPKKITLRANWEVREDWDYSTLPVWQQKPAELKGKATAKK